MGLLVAGITGGASLIDNARITALKGEVDNHTRDIFTFYAKVGRIPGDLNNDGQIGHASTKGKYATNSFPSPYQMGDIDKVCAPFIELYLYEISSFKPNTDAVTTDFVANFSTYTSNGAVPVSKKYKNIIFVHRTDSNTEELPSNDVCHGLKPNVKSIDVFMRENNKQTLEIAKKMESKFDDGSHSGGHIRSVCNNDRITDYNVANSCSEMIFPLDFF
jgi:hypothetical protein